MIAQRANEFVVDDRAKPETELQLAILNFRYWWTQRKITRSVNRMMRAGQFESRMPDDPEFQHLEYG